MNALSSVKTALLISFIFAVSTASAKMEVIPHLSCGDYLVRGHLVFTRSGDFILRWREKTSSPFELILLGGDPEEKLKNSNSNVVAKVSVNRKIESNNHPFVNILSFGGEAKDFAKDQDYKLLKKHSCKVK
ncbi:MAG TPA: hypothetical protein VN132_12655 [Bdellovibrio sp.]|nr:hypothetical protein [Bdellovibrio sp.]